jgi:hypothetical protein
MRVSFRLLLTNAKVSSHYPGFSPVARLINGEFGEEELSGRQGGRSYSALLVRIWISPLF